MSDYTSGSITFSGIASSTDFDTLIEGLLEVESYTLEKYEDWLQTWEDKVAALQDLNAQLLELQDTLSSMDTPNEFEVKSVTVSNSAYLTATADSDAESGSHTITVKQLAANDILVHDTGYASEDASVNNSGSNATFSYTYQGETYTVDVSDGATLGNLTDIINNDTENPGVRAAVISDGENYYLQLRGLDLGSDAQVEINDAGTTLSGFDSSSFDNTQEAASALYKIDGWPSGSDSWISNASNTISNSLSGINISLKYADYDNPVTITLTTDVDTDAIKENIETFVEQMNAIRTSIQDLTAYDADAEKGSIFTGNYGVQQLVGQRLKDIVASIGVGFEFYDADTGTGDIYCSLADLGILTNADEGSSLCGLLEIDETVLDEKLAADPDAVTAIFAAYYDGQSNSSDMAYNSYIEDITKAGVYDVSYTVSGGSIVSATINGHEADIDGWILTGAYGQDEGGLSITATNHADGTYNGSVSLKLGKIGELVNTLEDMTSEETGAINILEDNYDDIIDNIEDKILSEEERLSNYEQRLTDKFSRLETTLGEYSNISATLTQLINQMGSST
jgi:flagellar hook-associated protein 2